MRSFAARIPLQYRHELLFASHVTCERTFSQAAQIALLRLRMLLEELDDLRRILLAAVLFP